MKLTLLGFFLLGLNLANAEEFKFLRANKDALQARVDLIQEAKKELLVEYYSVWNDDQSIGGMALLIDAAKRGVKVKVIVDALSNTIPKQTFAALLAIGNVPHQNLEIKVYNPLSLNLLKATHRDHAKMLIADGENLITGGRNVGDKYFGVSTRRNYIDLDLLAKGEVAVTARENFLKTWSSKLVKEVKLGKYSPSKLSKGACGSLQRTDKPQCEQSRKLAVSKLAKEKIRIEKIREEIITNQVGDLFISDSGNDWFSDSFNVNDVTFMSHGTDKLVTKETAFLNKDLLSAIASAENEVNIVSPYLIPTDNLLEVFKELLKNGVRVKILTNSMNSTDNLFAQAGYRKMKAEMISIGIELYEYNGPDALHAKTALVDNKIILIGTYNIDPRSAFINREIGVIIKDSQDSGLASELGGIISELTNNSTLVGINGVAQGEDDLKDTSTGKKVLLKIITTIVPLIKNQL